MSKSEPEVIAEGLAALATSLCEMDLDDSHVRARLMREWKRVGAPAGLFTSAAAAVTQQPQPLLESAEETERSRPIREYLGLADAASQLDAALRARHLLQQMASDLSE